MKKITLLTIILTLFLTSWVGLGMSANSTILDSYSNLEFFDLTTKTAGALGYAFGVMEGNYLYAAPCYYKDGTDIQSHGIMARYDKSKRFDLAAGWETYDVKTNVDADMKGYHGAASDGTYIYYAPLWRSYQSAELNDTVARYTISPDFTTGWTHYHLTNKHAEASGYVGAVKAGQWIYFIPYGVLTYPTQNHGIVIRHDTTCVGGFLDDACWEVYDISNVSGSNDLRGYHLGCYDGKYIYLSPYANGLGPSPYYESRWHGKVARHNVSGAINTGWEWIDLQTWGGNYYASGLYGCTVSGDYVYFGSNTNVSPIVARYTRQVGGVETTFNSLANWGFQSTDYAYGAPSGVKGGYAGADSTSGYAYFAPDLYWDDTGGHVHGWAARHDITKSFPGLYVTSRYPSLGWEFVNLTDKNANLIGQHGVVVDPTTSDLYFIPVRNVITPVYDGYFSRHIFKKRGGSSITN